MIRVQLVAMAGILFSPPHPDWIQGPPSFLSNEDQGLFPAGKATGA